MKKSTRKSFIDATYRMFNGIREWNGYKIARVMWHEDREWKLVDTDDFDVIIKDDYKPIAEFHLREDLWEYLKTKI